jgi:Zn-dependent M28 family amino/carboxypeptidase
MRLSLRVWECIGFAAAVLAAGSLVAAQAPATISPAVKTAFATFSAKRLLGHIRVLSSDKFEGRGPGTVGEKLSIQYIQEQFQKVGLAPGNPDGTYLQNVPLEGITADPKTIRLTFRDHGKSLSTRFGQDYVAWTKRIVPDVKSRGELVFVGYGIDAPTFHWNDFKGANLKGKILVVLVNNPSFKYLGGKKAMTYYGRWTYKFEEAARLGAAGCLIVHETVPAGYPWAVVQGSWMGEQFTLANPNKNMNRAPFEGWISHETAEKLFRMAGKNFDRLEAAAQRRDFRPVALGVSAQMEIHNALREVDSHNVVGKLEGSDPKLRNQYVIYTAHWDHFGKKDGKIFHGADDNGSGVSALIELGRAFKALPKPPRRTLIFISVTAEEQGLLGSEYYTEHPLYPLARTAANINMDALNVWGPTRDIVSIGMGESTIDKTIEAAAHALGRVVHPDPEPGKGYFFRSDHFNFVKQGVPAFDPDAGIDYIGKPAGWGEKIHAEFIANDYHKPSDVIKPNWNMKGTISDCELFFLVGYDLANAPGMPEWNPGSEFRAAREASLKAAGMKE